MSAPRMIHWYVTTRSSKSVAPIAIAMPTAATWFPDRAVRGEESRFRPMMKSDAATRYAAPIASALLIARALSGPPAEHVQHPVGDEEPADDVRRSERHADRSEHRRDGALIGSGDEDGADDHDAVDGVRTAHERRVQGRRHLRDDLDPDERRQDEHGQLDEQALVHAVASWRSRLVTRPSCVTTASAVISSSKSSATAPSTTRCSSTAWMFRAYIWLAWSGIPDGRLRVPISLT